MPLVDQEEEDISAMDMTRCHGRTKSARWDRKEVVEPEAGLVLSSGAAEVAQCFEVWVFRG